MNKQDEARTEIIEAAKSGYTIIPDSFLSLGLEPLEILLLGAVHRYSQHGNKLMLSPNQAAKVYGKSPNTIKKAFKNLIDKNLIFKKAGNTKNQIANKYWLNYTTLKNILNSHGKAEPRAEIDLGQKLPKATSKIDLGQNLTNLGQKLPYPRSKFDPNNRYIINNKNIEEEVEEEKTTSSSTISELEKSTQPIPDDTTLKQSAGSTPNSELKQSEQTKQPAPSRKKKGAIKTMTPQDSEPLSKIMMIYRENICMANKRYQPTPIEMNKLKKLVEEHSADMVEKAIERAVTRGKFDMGYITGILTRWKNNGYDDGKASASPKQQQTEQRPGISSEVKKPHYQKPTLDPDIAEAAEQIRKNKLKTSQDDDSAVLSSN